MSIDAKSLTPSLLNPAICPVKSLISPAVGLLKISDKSLSNEIGTATLRSVG